MPEPTTLGITLPLSSDGAYRVQRLRHGQVLSSEWRKLRTGERDPFSAPGWNGLPRDVSDADRWLAFWERTEPVEPPSMEGNDAIPWVVGHYVAPDGSEIPGRFTVAPLTEATRTERFDPGSPDECGPDFVPMRREPTPAQSYEDYAWDALLNGKVTLPDGSGLDFTNPATLNVGNTPPDNSPSVEHPMTQPSPTPAPPEPQVGPTTPAPTQEHTSAYAKRMEDLRERLADPRLVRFPSMVSELAEWDAYLPMLRAAYDLMEYGHPAYPTLGDALRAVGAIHCQNCTTPDDDPAAWCDCRQYDDIAIEDLPDHEGACKRKAHDPSACLWRPNQPTSA